MGVPHEKVNVNGGAIALGHPLGATGAMLVGTCSTSSNAVAEARSRDAVRRRWHGHRDDRRVWAMSDRRSWDQQQTIRYELDADGIATLTFDEPDSPSTPCARVAGRHGRSRRAGSTRQGAHQRRAARVGEDDLLRRRRN
jgi:hypothetical protein